MKKYHVISAKRMGWNNGDRTYEHFFFPTDEYSKERVLSPSSIPFKRTH